MGEDQITIDQLSELGHLQVGEIVRASALASPLGGLDAFGMRLAPNALAPAIGGINGLAEQAEVELFSDPDEIMAALGQGVVLAVTNRRIIVLSTAAESARPHTMLFTVPLDTIGAIRTGRSRAGIWKLLTITLCTATQEIGFEFPRVSTKDARRVIEACHER